MAYRLVRTLPDGTVKPSGVALVSVREAAKFAGMSLYDNRCATKAEAQRFSVQLARQPLGTDYPHPSGYSFRIERTD